MFKNKSTLSEFGMFFITILWGYGFIATKAAAEHYTSSQIIFYRFLIASAVLTPVFFKEFKNTSKKDIINGAILGVFLYFGFFLQTEAINHTTVAKNAFLTTLNVIIVPILAAAVHKERVDKYSIAGCILAVIGTGILSLNMDFSINFGDFLSIICAVFFSLHIFYQGIFVNQTKASVLVTVQFVVAALLSLITMMVMGEIKIEGYYAIGIMGIVYLGLFSTSFCLLLQAICQKYASPVKAVVIFSMEAVFASIFAFMIFKDPVTPRFLIGSATIFAAVIVSTTKLSFLQISELHDVN